MPKKREQVEERSCSRSPEGSCSGSGTDCSDSDDESSEGYKKGAPLVATRSTIYERSYFLFRREWFRSLAP
jgi:hypothetical protein